MICTTTSTRIKSSHITVFRSRRLIRCLTPSIISNASQIDTEHQRRTCFRSLLVFRSLFADLFFGFFSDFFWFGSGSPPFPLWRGLRASETAIMGGFHHGLMINAYDMTEGWGHEVETRREIIQAASRVIINGFKSKW